MATQHGFGSRYGINQAPGWLALAVLGAALACAAFTGSAAQAQAASAAGQSASDNARNPPASHAATHISPEQAKDLFALVDQLIQFSSQETGLPDKNSVKRQLITRDQVEKYLQQKFDEDRSAQRLQQDEILLKKFGLLDRDFALRPFLLALLKEQIEAFYDEKTRTVNLLDWVDVDEQKPVMAHELTHALQDQRINLAKWGDQTPDEVSKDASGDADHLVRDEWDTAREAVTEGQATAVMMDYILKPLGKSLVKNPEVIEAVQDQMTGSGDTPVMARAPLLLSESMLFPYRDGLSFEQDVWMDQGQAAAFAQMLDHPPTSSWEIMNPREFEQRHAPPVPLLPNIHPLVDKLYKPYDIGQMGQLDLHILAKLLGGDDAAGRLTSAWNGGLYWAGQLRSARTGAERASTASVALFYLSAWRNQASAAAFARLYGENLGRKYRDVKAEEPIESGNETTQVFATSEGPVLITTRGKLVFISESFPAGLAHSLTELLLDAQGSGEMRMARAASPAAREHTLTAGLVHLFGQCGVLKAVVRAGMQASRAGSPSAEASLLIRGDEALIKPGMTLAVPAAADTQLHP